MGDHFQTIVDLDATAEEAPALAARAVAWLAAEGIVRAERTDCVLGKPLGHPPGPNWARTASPDDADRDPSDGLDVTTGRTVFFGGQGDADWADCPSCGGRTLFGPGDADRYDPLDDDTPADEGGEPLDEEWESFSRAMDAWSAMGEASVECRHCGVDIPIIDWTWSHDYYAFGHLGLQFWNWPEFRQEFVAELGTVLGGHRTVVVWGKL
ncbi:hypothetical protein OHS70_20545 [Streptomyces sp. NBC_00390]|uniref:hypothetical protein n=1 Tax=Streptomyces sp. NBC_00390 TaxID=2975736 RepID=UPI002E1B4B0F